MPIEAQKLQGYLSKVNEFDPSRLDQINSKLGDFEQYSSQNGIMFKNIQMRSDLLHYSDSSEEDQDNI